jgi:hypothetical protein
MVADPVEGRQLAIPRDAFAGRADDGLRLRPDAVRARGAGPERYRRRASLADDWVSEQSAPSSALTAEGDDPLHARHLVEEGVLAPADEDAGEAVDNVPSELEHPRRRDSRRARRSSDLRLGSPDRPSARELTPAIAPTRRGR